MVIPIESQSFERCEAQELGFLKPSLGDMDNARFLGRICCVASPFAQLDSRALSWYDSNGRSEVSEPEVDKPYH